MTFQVFHDRTVEQPARVTFVVFEGGSVPGAIETRLQKVRFAVTLDTIERIVDSLNRHINIILYSDNEALLESAAAIVPYLVTIKHTGDDFHFGHVLRDIINQFSLERVLAFGGASAPLYFPEIWRFYERLLTNRSNLIVENNPGSADVIGFHPASAINEIDPPPIDNHLGRVLRKTGLKRILIPNTSELHFDIDIPTDIAVLREIGGDSVGLRTARAIDESPFQSDAIATLADRLRTQDNRPSLCLAGRVETSSLQFFRANFPMKMNCLMEGRGLRYLIDQNEMVMTPTGKIVEFGGFEGLFDILGTGVEYVAFDWRPLMASLGRELTQEDRFCADMFLTDQIVDPVLRELSRVSASRERLILGAHCLVSGGLWNLGRTILKEQGRQEWRPFPGRIS